ncbi:protein of unknown function DUF167 [Hymenobacter roseosalivarius DSM 11622]|uniref:UPF0235 protein SAMN00120144_3457 n=1 Tax=Hymenobacter roseosalivarius DSM 11622 TaxID=645990 RepID=A0A1W1V5T0_9BACT|nr:DUF167 domain-containing protein [Hymenobacter roseosalivarius]SMB88645.1 protein of unknown function DUF167 [Hymenobacter roseosalivarius DSM 11622]
MSVILHITAKPNARTNHLLVAANGELVVRIKAPAHAGQANTELAAYLAQVFGLSKSSVIILTGHTAPFKKIRLDGLTDEDCQRLLAQHQA